MSKKAGHLVSHYEIVSELGRGGMGIVYRARDLDLGRQVALKQPGPELASDPHAKRRFQREARAAARLMHPHIVPVLEVFEAEGEDWLVMELVEGKNLRELIRGQGALPLGEILRHAEGLAAALELSHARGILHRDIKCGNVLVGDDGRARLTDFGLVRFFSPPGETSAATTLSGSLTDAGKTVGTPAYMSPEQALGKPVDRRSDVYSFGSVLYEMCTGQPAVVEEEFGAALDAVLHHEPKSISRLNYAIPDELERIVRKCMRKSPDERYQEVRDLLVDLRTLRRGEARPFSGGRKWKWWYVVPALVLAIGAVWGGREIYLRLTSITRTGPPTFRSRQVTAAPGWEAEAAISPGGGEIAYVSDQSGNPDIWLIDAIGGNPLQLTRDPASDRTPAWTTDGSAIVFTSDRSGQDAIWRVPRLGGTPVMVVPRGLDPAPSPDGRFLAFASPVSSGELRIAIVALDASEQVRTLTGDNDGVWRHRNPAWSPDGKTICYQDWRHLWLVDTDGGHPRQLTFDGLADREPVWSPDGRHVYFSSERGGTAALWMVAVAGGEPNQVTQGTGPERRPSLSRDGSRIAYSTLVEDFDLVLVNLADGRRERLSALGEELNAGLAPEASEIVFVSDRWGQRALWSQHLTRGRPSGNPRRLTDHPGTASNPTYSPDGRWISYHRVLNDQRDVWIIPSSGGQPTQVTEDPGIDVTPAWSPDGSLIAFSSDRGGSAAIWVKPVANGRPAGPGRQIASGSFSAYAPVWSPDGKRIAFAGLEDERKEIYVVPADGAGPVHRVTDGARAARVAWDSATGELLVSGSWGTGQMTLRRIPPEGGRGVPFEPPLEFGPVAVLGDFDVSADGSVLVFTREEARGDIWVMETERNNPF